MNRNSVAVPPAPPVLVDTVRSVELPNGLYALIGYDEEGVPAVTLTIDKAGATGELAREVLKWTRNDYQRRHPSGASAEPHEKLRKLSLL